MSCLGTTDRISVRSFDQVIETLAGACTCRYVGLRFADEDILISEDAERFKAVPV